MSSKDRENKYTGAIFTDIHYHIDWITKIYTDFKSNTFNLTKIICSQSGDWSINYRNLCSSKYPRNVNNLLLFIVCTKSKTVQFVNYIKIYEVITSHLFK